MKIIKTATTSVSNFSPQIQDWIYNGLDCCVTAEVQEALEEKLQSSPDAAKIYAFERLMQKPAMTMQLRGVRIAEIPRQRLVIALKEESKGMRKDCDAFFREHSGIDTEALKKELKAAETRYAVTEALKPKDRNTVERRDLRKAQTRLKKEIINSKGFIYKKAVEPSGKQIQKLFYGAMKIPAMRNKKGIISTDKEVLKRIEKKYKKAAPLCKLVNNLRDMQKQLEVLTLAISPDGRMRACWNVGATDTGRWCVPGSTEVLTPGGWVAIKDWFDDTESIMQWNTDGTLSWRKAKKHEFTHSGDMISVSNNRVTGVFTPEHKILCCSDKIAHTYYKREAKTFPLNRTITAGMLTTEFVSSDLTRLWVMLNAAGFTDSNGATRIKLNKPRKIIRCLQLLRNAGISAKDHKRKTHREIYVKKSDVPKWLRDTSFNAKLLQHDPRIFLEELLFWSGSKTENTYYTTNVSDAEWVKTMSHLNGCFASINERSYGDKAWKTCFRVRITKFNKTRLKKEHYSKTGALNLKVYCPETPSGYWLMRHNGDIWVTGNSSSSDPFGEGTNQQSQDRRIRHIYMADPGMEMLNADGEQAESRCIAYLAQDQNYIDAHEKGNVHLAAGRNFWPNDLDWNGDDEHDIKLMKYTPAGWIPQPDVAPGTKPAFNYYDMSKRGQHGLNYVLSPNGLAIWLGVTRHAATMLYEKYFTQYPGILDYHRSIRMQLKETAQITTPLGRPRQFFERPWEESTVRKAVAHVPQSLTSDIIKIGMIRVWNELDPDSVGSSGKFQLLMDGHDAILGQMKLGDDETAARVKELMRVEVPIHGKIMVIPISIERGPNWRDCK